MTKKQDEELRLKWERILERKGLGLYQPMTDHSDGEMADLRGLSNEDRFENLRKKIDGSDGFMDGHQITKYRNMEREVPEWALNNLELRRILLRSFPSLGTNEVQRKRAAKWVKMIHLYYRMKLPRQIVAKEMKMGEGALKSMIRNVSRAARGTYQATGKTRACHPSAVPVRETGEGRHERIESSPLHIAGDGSTRTGGATS